MTDKPSLRKGSGSAGSSDSATPTPPRFVLYAVAALVLSGVMALLASATLYTGGVKSWVRDNSRDSLVNSMLDKVDDAKKAGPTTAERTTRITALQNQLKDLKKTPSTELTPKLTPIYASVASLKTGASAKGKKNYDDIKGQLDDTRDIKTQISAQQKGALLSSIIVLVALSIAAAAAFKGRSWARWAVLGLWVLATFTGTLAGLGSVLSIAADIPALFKFPAFVSGLALVVAVVLSNLRPSVAFFNQGRPVRPGSAASSRRGLFSPRLPAPSTTQAPAAKPAAASTPDRSRTKQRASTDSVAKGAELARQRAKASKSRRTGA